MGGLWGNDIQILAGPTDGWNLVVACYGTQPETPPYSVVILS